MKIKSFLLSLLVMLGFIISNFIFNDLNEGYFYSYNAFQDYVREFEGKKTIPVWITPSEDLNEKYFIETMQLFADENDSSFVIVSVDKKSGISTTNFYLYTRNEKLNDELHNKTNKDIDFSSLKGNAYYSSDQTDSEAYDNLFLLNNHIFDRFDTVINIHQVNNALGTLKNEQGFSIYFYDNNINQFDSKLTKVLAENKLDKSVEVINSVNGYHSAVLGVKGEITSSLNELIFFVGLIYVIYLVIYYTKQRKEIVIQRIYGKSIQSIIGKKLILFSSFSIIVFNAALYGGEFLIAKEKLWQDNTLSTILCNVTIISIIIMIASSILIFIILYYTTSLKELKKSSNSTKKIWLYLSIKILVILFITSPMINAFDKLNYDMKLLSSLNQSYDVLSNTVYIDNDLSASKNTKVVFDYFLNENAIYCDFMSAYGQTYEVISESLPDIDKLELKEITMQYPAIYVNAEYLKGKTIYTKDNQVIDVKKIEKNTLLVPSKYKNENFTFITDDETTNVIEIQDTGTFLNYSLQYPFTMDNPVIYLQTEASLNEKLNYLYIPLYDKSVKQVEDKIFQLTNEKVNLVKYKSRLDSQTLFIQSDVKEYGTLFGIYLVLFIGLIYQSAFTFVEEYRKLISVQYIFGKSKLERYGSLYLINAIFYSLPFIINLSFYKTPLITLLILYSLCILLEMVLIYVFTRKMEHNNIAIVLKGETTL